jgi:predicted Zn-dependent peptidase
MRGVGWAVVLAAVLVGVSAGAAPEGFQDPAAATRVTRLENGLTILTLEDRSTPVVSFQVWVKAGSRDESRFTGIAHLFEHMMFRGTENLGPEEFTQLIQARGGRLNAFTSHDVTVYFEDIPPDALPLVIDLEAERFANLVIDEALLATEREVVLEERRMRTEDSPQGRAFEALMPLTFKAHPYRWPVIGWRSDVEQVTVEACREFFASYYAPNNLVISVAGDFDSEDTLARIRERWGGMQPADVIPRTLTREPEQRGERTSTVHFDVRGPVVMIAWHAPPTGHEDGPALDLLSTVLSGGRSSRLYRRLVNDEQLALSAGGGYWELHDAGVFFGRVAVRPDADPARAREAFLDEIERVRTHPIRAEELEKAQRQLEVGLVNGQGTAHGLADRVGRDYVAFGRIRPLEELLGGIEAVTLEDIQRVAQRYLRPEGRNVVRVVPPPQDAEETSP